MKLLIPLVNLQEHKIFSCLKPSIIMLEEKGKEVFCEISDKSLHFEVMEKNKFQGLTSECVVCDLNPWVREEWELTQLYTSSTGNIYKKHILML